MVKYNLQFFGENDDDNKVVDDIAGDIDNGGNIDDAVDIKALAEIISDKDKQIEQLQKDVEQLKKSNANLTIMVNSDKSSSGKLSFEENLLKMVGAKPRKE
jgi:hypothetical protein